MKSPQRSTFVMTIPPHVCFGYCSAAISSHHSAVTGHVAGKDGRKPSFDPRTHHKNRPDLVATTQVYGGGRASVYRGHDVRFGSKTGIGARLDHVRFTPKSGHS